MAGPDEVSLATAESIGSSPPLIRPSRGSGVVSSTEVGPGQLVRDSPDFFIALSAQFQCRFRETCLAVNLLAMNRSGSGCTPGLRFIATPPELLMPVVSIAVYDVPAASAEVGFSVAVRVAEL